MTGLIITALLFPIAGCIAGRRPLAESFLFGLGVVGASLFVFGVFHVPFIVTVILILIAGIAGFVWGPASAGRDRLKPVPTLFAIIPLLLIAIPAAIVPLDDFDGRCFWLLKAKALANERVIDGPFFHNQVVHDPRNQYPLLIPLDAATVMIASGQSDDSQVRWIYLFTFAALVFHIARRVHPWCAAILAWTPQFLVGHEGGALTAYCDIAFAAFLACAFFELIDGRSPLRFSMWLSFLVLTKNEGLPVAIVLIAVAIAFFGRRAVGAIVAPAIAAATLFFWRSGIPKTDEEDYLTLLPRLPWKLARLIPVVVESAKHFFDVTSWGLLWIAIWIAIIVLLRRREWQTPAVVLAISAVYIGAYMVTNWTMIELIDASADRLLMHMIGPGLFAIARVTDWNGQNRYSPQQHPPTPT